MSANELSQVNVKIFKEKREGGMRQPINVDDDEDVTVAALAAGPFPPPGAPGPSRPSPRYHSTSKKYSPPIRTGACTMASDSEPDSDSSDDEEEFGTRVTEIKRFISRFPGVFEHHPSFPRCF